MIISGFCVDSGTGWSRLLAAPRADFERVRRVPFGVASCLPILLPEHVRQFGRSPQSIAPHLHTQKLAMVDEVPFIGMELL